MDFSTTPTKAFHEDQDFSMGNIYSPSACETEKKRWSCLLKLIYTTHQQNIYVFRFLFSFHAGESKAERNRWSPRRLYEMSHLTNLYDICGFPKRHAGPGNFTWVFPFIACGFISVSTATWLRSWHEMFSKRTRIQVFETCESLSKMMIKISKNGTVSCLRPWQTRTHCCGHIVADTNVSRLSARKTNICCGHKFCVPYQFLKRDNFCSKQLGYTSTLLLCYHTWVKNGGKLNWYELQLLYSPNQSCASVLSSFSNIWGVVITRNLTIFATQYLFCHFLMAPSIHCFFFSTTKEPFWSIIAILVHYYNIVEEPFTFKPSEANPSRLH